ncbi:MAG: urea ABC transporter substrate-binding protein [Treponema sp.]|nr:urea ABC transporter substrate-binding protein [Treponema sp.]
MKMHNLIFKTCVLSLAMCAVLFSCKKPEDKYVKVGILHSESGSMAASEKPLMQAELLAIEEINSAGGVLGHEIVPVIEDGESNARVFADRATKLIEKEGVATIFGCWTSDSRKAVKPIVEDHYNLLWYPLQYEGMEASPNIMYMGAAPNQQIVPAIDYCFENFGKRFFLLGSDYVFPQTANRIIKAQLKELGGIVTGEEYVSLMHTDFEEIIEHIKLAKPDIIINTLNGDSNVSFFAQLKEAGVTPESIPVMSFSIGESEIQNIGTANCMGNYVTWTYFQTTETSANRKFIQSYKAKYGESAKIEDPVEAAYIAVYLWAAACEKAGTFEVEPIRIAAKGLSYIAPEGMVTIEGSNQHLNKTIRIGVIKADGQIEEIWSSAHQVRPDPYLSTYAWARGL